jgi:hypothetical protein
MSRARRRRAQEEQECFCCRELEEKIAKVERELQRTLKALERSEAKAAAAKEQLAELNHALARDG